MEDFLKTLRLVNGKRIVYDDPTFKPHYRTGTDTYFIDIDVTNDVFRLIIPIDNLSITNRIVNMLREKMEPESGGRLIFNFDNVRIQEDRKALLRVYSFDINDKTISQIKQNLWFVLSSSGVYNKYGIIGKGIFFKTSGGEYKPVHQNELIKIITKL